jgi:hypothetical protein
VTVSLLYFSPFPSATVLYFERLLVLSINNTFRKDLGTVAQACNSTYPGGTGRRIKVQGRHGQKHKTLFKK